MPVIAIVNRKGGSGKTTLAVHLAVQRARSGETVMLGDLDRQQSTQDWLRRREQHQFPGCGAIIGRPLHANSVLRAPTGITSVVLDTPGGLRGLELARVVMAADAIVMPVCNSAFDRDSAAEGYAEMLSHPRVSSGRCQVAVVGMRVDSRTKGAEVLAQWAAQYRLPFIGVLREAQAYVHCVEEGLTLFDLPPAKVAADMAQWEPILQKIAQILSVPGARTEESARATAQGSALPLVEPRWLYQSPSAESACTVEQAAAIQLEAVANLQYGGPVVGSPAWPERSSIAERVGAWVSSLPRLLLRNPQL